MWSIGFKKEVPETAKRSEYSWAALVDRSGIREASWDISRVFKPRRDVASSEEMLRLQPEENE